MFILTKPLQRKILIIVIPILQVMYSLTDKNNLGTCDTECNLRAGLKLLPWLIASNVAHAMVFLRLYRRIYCHKFFMLSNQTSHNILKYIGIVNNNLSTVLFSHSNILLNYYIYMYHQYVFSMELLLCLPRKNTLLTNHM